ncbi:MAG: 3'(2'),5'-bisphosphate nucleotidase CysQ [Rhizobiales bacterium]|nr:3'(2'),5'-bisphosphate nucleotidase CysQ [Hyphomicrobiales bacterium]
MRASDDTGITAQLGEAVREAGAYALSRFRSQFRTWTKGMSSPVSEVDIAVDEMLRKSLAALDSAAAWLSEESIDDLARLQAPRVWIVDPIDGTRSFIGGLADWAVSAALVEAGRPVAAALFAPAENAMYLATAGRGTTINGAALRATDSSSLAGARATGPKRRLDALAALGTGIVPVPRIGSLALRIARVASGEIDIAFAGGNSHDWDLAAADLIVLEAGATLSAFDGTPVTYNRAEPVHGSLVAAARERHAVLVGLMRREAAAFAAG